MSGIGPHADEPPIVSRDHDGSTFPLKERMNNESLDSMLAWASSIRASDIRLTSGKAIKARVAGKNVPLTDRALTHPEIEDVLRCVYSANGPIDVLSGDDTDAAHAAIAEGRIDAKGFHQAVERLPEARRG